jgi:hypothetical protein
MHPSLPSRYGTTALAALLNGIERICPHHSMWTGLCSATKAARARTAASRWLRVAILQPREDSRSARNRRTGPSRCDFRRQGIRCVEATPDPRSRWCKMRAHSINSPLTPSELPLIALWSVTEGVRSRGACRPAREATLPPDNPPVLRWFGFFDYTGCEGAQQCAVPCIPWLLMKADVMFKILCSALRVT